MARIRSIKPEFWESESVGRLSMGARLLFVASLNFADDEGLLRWNEAYLSSQAFSYDDLRTEQISEWMRELVNESIIFPYKAGTTNQRLAWIIHFRTHQVINRPQPGKLPPPSIQNMEFKKALFARDRNICHLCGTLVDELAPPNISGSKAPSIDHVVTQSDGGTDYPSNLRTAHISCNKSRGNKHIDDSVNNSVNNSVNDSLLERKGKEGNGRERKGNGKDKDTAPSAPASRPKRSKPVLRPLPENWKPSERTVEAMTKEFRFKPGDCDRYLTAFADACLSKGYQYQNFDAAFRNCIRQDWPKLRANGQMRPQPKTAAELIDEDLAKKAI